MGEVTTNQDGPTPDDFAMKVWREANSMSIETTCEGFSESIADDAAARVLSEAFDKVRAEERARIVAWLQREAGKPYEVHEHVLLAVAEALERGAHDNG